MHVDRYKVRPLSARFFACSAQNPYTCIRQMVPETLEFSIYEVSPNYQAIGKNVLKTFVPVGQTSVPGVKRIIST